MKSTSFTSTSLTTMRLKEVVSKLCEQVDAIQSF